ncbi:MAG: SDR family NAD(P)-dependent oxidoreductase, partial [Microthrixaceae bacterium]|nr:SDR family NAD(P)-dependent oxidoreductase [Microthrixaceae bacterium]
MARHSSPPFDPAGKVAVVTGAAGGIGAALVRALCAQGASVVVATDLDADHTAAVAEVLDAEAPSTRVVGTGLD